jgi:hypothetical protein
MRKQRPIDMEKQLSHLERKHERLKARVAEYDGLSFLTDEDAMRRAALKKKKLATKDALFELRRAGQFH